MNPENDATGESTPGSVSGIAARVAQWVTTRVELVAFEFTEERRHLIRLLVLGAAVGVLAVIGLFLLTLAILWSLPPEWRALGAAIIALLYGGTATAIALKIRSISATRPPPFSATLEELRRDRDWFKSLK
ncbi:MAG: phage holin family protein [Verrucomicrobiales bacterium]|nr:phage holin family protein [Verrucomicrobiales bacterium]